MTALLISFAAPGVIRWLPPEDRPGGAHRRPADHLVNPGPDLGGVLILIAIAITTLPGAT